MFCPVVTSLLLVATFVKLFFVASRHFVVDFSGLGCYHDFEEVKTLKDRIKQIRKDNDLTQQEFATRLGVSRSGVASYENGDREPINAVISLICREFDINEEWLRYGTGPMTRSTSREEEIETMVTNALNGNANLTKAVVQALCKRSEKELEVLEALLWDIVYARPEKNNGRDESQPKEKRPTFR